VIESNDHALTEVFDVTDQALAQVVRSNHHALTEVDGVRKPIEHLTIQEELGELPNGVEFLRTKSEYE
jgi:hypothetical protein